LLQDFRKLSVGKKIEFKVNPTPKFPATDLEHIKIDIIIDGEVVGHVHTVDYIRPDRVVNKNDNLSRNIEELVALRKAIVGGLNQDVEAKKADIERRRQEELDDELSWRSIASLEEMAKRNGLKLFKIKNYEIGTGEFDAKVANFLKPISDKINAKYDAELAALEKPQDSNKNGISESTIEKVGNGRLITEREFGGEKTTNKPTNEALPDKNLTITIADNGVIINPPKNGLILNNQKILTGTNNNFKNGIFALIPVNKTNINGFEQIVYIAAPLSPQRLNESQADSLSTLVEMFLRNYTGQ